MNKQNQVVQYLLDSGEEVTALSIKAKSSDISPIARSIAYDIDQLTNQNLLELGFESVKISSEREEWLSSLGNRLAAVKTKISEGMLKIGQEMNASYEAILDASSSEKLMTGIVDSVIVDTSSNIFTNKDETNASVKDSVVYGVKEKDLYGDMLTSILNDCRLSCQVYSEEVIRSGAIEIQSNKRRSVYDGSQDIDASTLTLVGELKSNTKSYIDLIIDKKSSVSTNAISLTLSTITPVMILTSDDNKVYKQESKLPQVISDAIIPISNSSSRYIKVRFTKNEGDELKNGVYRYITGIKKISLSSGLIKDQVQYQTNEIVLQRNISSVSLQTCCTYESKVSNIDYYVSIDGGDWEPIRPSGKFKNKDSTLLKSSVSPGLFKSNSIEELVRTEDGHSTGIESQYRNANELVFFRKNLRVDSADWKFDGIRRQCWIILDNEKVIDIGDKIVFIGAKQFTGRFTLTPGIHTVSVDQSDYINLFNLANIVGLEYKEDVDAYRVTLKDGTSRIVNTINGPRNVKAEIEMAADSIFTDKVDIQNYQLIEVNGTLHLPNKTESKIYMAYRPSVKYINSIKIKAVMSSVNGEAIPFIRRIILHLT